MQPAGRERVVIATLLSRARAQCRRGRLVLAVALLFGSLLASSSARAQTWREPGTSPVSTPPPRVGDCIGGDCTPELRARPSPPRRRARARPSRRARFAYTGATLGAVSAGLLLGGALAIELVDDRSSERITRGLWLGELALATPIVALSAYLGRKGSTFAGYRGLRGLGWAAYAAATADGIILWHFAFRDYEVPMALGISAGVIAAFALLPHALDAVASGRRAGHRGFTLDARGLRVSF